MPNKSQKKQQSKQKGNRIKLHPQSRGFKHKHKHRTKQLRDNINNLTKPHLTPTTDMSEWNDINLPSELLLALREMNFSSPTPIQRMSIPPATACHNVIGAAETGSGKTLAFGIPVLTGILQRSNDDNICTENERVVMDTEDKVEGDEMGCLGWVDDIPDAEFERMLSDTSMPSNSLQITPPHNTQVTKPLQALILTPTRELCLQICSHLRSAAIHTSISVVALVGGLSISKQTRLLSRHPEIVASTPGRYLQLLEEGNKYCQELSHLSYLVIDEVDRMLTEGHFANINLIFDRIASLAGTSQSHGPQVLLFSATVPSYFLNLKKHERDEPDGVRKLKRYLSRKKTDVINLTRKNVLVEKLREHRLMVESSNKLYYLYYLLLRKGKVLVFSNSIASLRQLYGILTTLSLNILIVHSGMQQKQRLQNLEKFNSSEHAILLASDMTSRGIDFTDVSDVIHYHVPATVQLYVHRCGRTARTSVKGGSSLLLVAPEESRRYNTICRDLNKAAGIPNAEISLNEVYRYKDAVQLAIKLNKHENSYRKQTKDESWKKKANINLHGEYDMTSSEEDTPPTRQDRFVLREGKERLRNLLTSINKEDTAIRCYRDGLKTVSTLLTAGEKVKPATDIPYLPLIREKHRRL
ncbi:ATP-dependent RNA helicase DDX24-like [Oopsacas minuta]|uniref:ATP-dependent RNA helicase n=1 Tax=Oopsacas minuta TaxID=111878 RepID=A0AAV7KI30_9METZ|nr:ATP-dependent RNA helicase DDX24-like [Oopsacas minuta]